MYNCLSNKEFYALLNEDKRKKIISVTDHVREGGNKSTYLSLSFDRLYSIYNCLWSARMYIHIYIYYLCVLIHA